MEMCQQPRIKPNANKTINISLALPLCLHSSSRIHSLSDINGLVRAAAARANTKTFSSHSKKGNGCWFVRSPGAMMDAHGCCCTCLMNPQAGNHSLSLSNKFDLFCGLEATWKSLWWSHSLRAIGPKSMPLLDARAPKQESNNTERRSSSLMLVIASEIS